MKESNKAILHVAAQVGLFILRNWKVVTPIVGLVSVSAAALMGTLAPVVDAIALAVQ